MTAAGHRREHIAAEIQQEIGSMLEGELKDPRLSGLASVTEVRLSPDMKQARVYVCVSGDDAEQASTLEGLKAASGFIRHELSERLRLRRALDVSFVLDRSEDYGRRIEELIRNSKRPGQG